MTTFSTHPVSATYFGSRTEARLNCRPTEKIVRLGVFQSGSFGVYSKSHKQQFITVWMVCPK